MAVIIVAVGGGDGVLEFLTGLGGTDAVAEFAGPADDALELRCTGWCRGAHPGRGVEILARTPVLPGEVLGHAGIVDHEFRLRVDGVGPARERELEHLRLRDGLGRAGLDTEIAVDAAQIVDLVDEAVALTRRDRVLGIVLRSAHIDAPGGTDTGAQFAADALLHAVLVAVEDVATMDPEGLRGLLLRILGRDPLLASDLTQADEETSEVTHYSTTPCRRLALEVAMANRSRP